MFERHTVACLQGGRIGIGSLVHLLKVGAFDTRPPTAHANRVDEDTELPSRRIRQFGLEVAVVPIGVDAVTAAFALVGLNETDRSEPPFSTTESAV